MVNKISVIDITNEADDEPIIISDNEASEYENVNMVKFDDTPVNNKRKDNETEVDGTTTQNTVEQHQCQYCLKYMSLKSLRYTHDTNKYISRTQQIPKVKESPNTKLKNEITKAQNEYESLRQTQPNPPIHKMKQPPIQKVIMKTAKEKKQEKYSAMMENAF